MSSSLYWKPVVKDCNDLSTELKLALRRKYEGVEVNMDSGNIPYLEGLLHGGIDDAQKLIDAIKQNDEIIIWEQY